ncbi:MAG: phage minor capsid protein [Clostridium sp.]
MPLSPYDISSIYAEMEIDLAKSMKRNLKGHEIEEIKEGFKWEQWQKAKLRDIKKFQKRNKKIIKKYQKLIDGEVETLFDNTYKSSSEKSESLFTRLKGKIKGIFSRELQEEDFFKANEDKVFNLIKSVKGDLHNANSAALRQMDDVYRKTLFKANMYVANGASTVNQAVDMATKDFLSQGIRCIEYKNGRRVDIASYSEMAIRTANQRVTLMADGAVRDKHGIHTVLAPAHGNTCPLCLAWQGKVLIDDVYSSGKAREGKYPLLSTAMKEGFLHPNCRHHPATFIPGINSMPKEQTEEEKQEALNKYNAEQKQRYYERKIRKYKRLEAGSCDERNAEKYKQKVSEYQLELQKHLSENKFLRRDTWREKLRDHSLSKNTIPAYLRIKNKERISKSDLEIIEKDLNKLPAKHKEALEEYISEIEVGDFENSGYDRKTRRVRLINDLEEGEIIHELGHALETKFDLYNNEKYKKLLYNVVKNKGYGDIIYDNETFTTPITRLQADRFVSEYQGRLYEEVEIFSDDGGINPKSLGEYFSEGYREFIENPEKLMKKDSDLYNFIKELI